MPLTAIARIKTGLLAFRQALERGTAKRCPACSPDAIAQHLMELEAIVEQTFSLLGTHRADGDASITVLPCAMPLAEPSGVRP